MIEGYGKEVGASSRRMGEVKRTHPTITTICMCRVMCPYSFCRIVVRPCLNSSKFEQISL